MHHGGVGYTLVAQISGISAFKYGVHIYKAGKRQSIMGTGILI